MTLAENFVVVGATKAALVADVDKTARMVGNSSFHPYAGVLSLSWADLVLYRLLWSDPRSSYTYWNVATWLFRKDCRKLASWYWKRNRTSHQSPEFPWDIRQKKVIYNLANVLNWRDLSSLVAKTVHSRKRFTVTEKLTSSDDLKSHKNFKKMDRKAAWRTMDQQSIVDGCGLKTLFCRETFTSMIVTRQVGFKV